MRILAFAMTVMAISVWWHPMARPVQSLVLAGLACSCMAFREANKRAEDLRVKLVGLQDAVRPLRSGWRDDGDPQESIIPR